MFNIIQNQKSESFSDYGTIPFFEDNFSFLTELNPKDIIPSYLKDNKEDEDCFVINIPSNDSYFNKNLNLKETQDINAATSEKLNKFLVRKRGRKKNIDKFFCYHNKNSKDNIKRKIQVHFITFIIKFINMVLKTFKYKEQFKDIEQKFKINSNNKNIAELQKKNIGEILNREISSKFKKINKDYNKILYKKII